MNQESRIRDRPTRWVSGVAGIFVNRLPPAGEPPYSHDSNRNAFRANAAPGGGLIFPPKYTLLQAGRERIVIGGRGLRVATSIDVGLKLSTMTRGILHRAGARPNCQAFFNSAWQSSSPIRLRSHRLHFGMFCEISDIDERGSKRHQRCGRSPSWPPQIAETARLRIGILPQGSWTGVRLPSRASPVIHRGDRCISLCWNG
jgi:hypothetical protein